MPARRALVALGLAFAALLAGCVAAPPALPEGVTVLVMQQRSDVAERMAQLRVHNASDAALAFTAALRSARRAGGQARHDLHDRCGGAPYRHDRAADAAGAEVAGAHLGRRVVPLRQVAAPRRQTIQSKPRLSFRSSPASRS